jgi:hypothetical protein
MTEAEIRARQDAEAVAAMRDFNARAVEAKAAAKVRAEAALESRARAAAKKREAKQKERIARSIRAAGLPELRARLAQERKDTLARFMLDRGLERDLSSYSERDPDGLDLARERERLLSERDNIRAEWERLISKRPDSKREQ